MKKVTYKNKNGKIANCIYTTSTMPHTNRKRVRKIKKNNKENTYIVSINSFFIFLLIYSLFGATNLSLCARLFNIVISLLLCIEIKKK